MTAITALPAGSSCTAVSYTHLDVYKRQGVYTPTKGAIRFEGSSIIGKKPYQINRLGIARTFQNIRLFKNMTALDLSLIHI